MRIVVVGSGVSGCHAALSLLERGHAVELWDAGESEPATPLPGVSFHEFKDRVPEPIDHLLGSDLRALVPPHAPELMRYPPSRRFLASPLHPLWSFTGDDFVPFTSLAIGGLANGWGANALAFDDDDLAGWPVSFTDMDRAYRTAFARIPVAAPEWDDLTPLLDGVRVSQSPVPLTRSDEILLRRYHARATALRNSGVYLGRARLAVVTDELRPDACDRCDRCLWGCPRGSIYSPAATTLAACSAYTGFRHLPGRFVVSLAARDGRVTGLRFVDVATDTVRDEACDAVFLAAGALGSGAIFLRTLKAARPDLPAVSASLMDTTVVKIPFVSLRAVGQPAEARSFQFNRLILGLVGGHPQRWPRYLHGEVLHLTSLMYHPLIERMPFDTRTSMRLFFMLKPALGVVSLFFPDRATEHNRQVLVEGRERWSAVRLEYRETAEKEAFIARSAARVRAALWRLGCVPRGVVRGEPGAGIHYAGTVPMGEGPARCNADGRSNLFQNLFIADGAAFPSLPSKSITMSLAAHAIRVASAAEL